MAYNRKNSETPIYHEYEEKIKIIKKFQKKFDEAFYDLYRQVCIAYDTPILSIDEFYEKLRELMGSKTYKGRKLKLIEQYRISEKFRKVFLISEKHQKNKLTYF